MNPTYFYKDKPLFGLDIGFNSVKAMQIVPSSHGIRVSGYGIASFDSAAIKEGVIIDHEILAKTVHDLFKKHLIGDITTRRVAFSVPAARTFTRILSLPKLANSKDLTEAVHAEAEQYIPVPIEELYLDYSIISSTAKTVNVIAVAVSKRLIDSYMQLANILGLEVAAMESTISSTSRLFGYTDQHQVPTVLIDFGSVSTDITIYDKTLIVTGTVSGGGDDFTNSIAKALNVTKQEAHVIKTKYGLGVSKKQKEIKEAITPILQQMNREVRRTIRYYEERADDSGKKIGQIVTLGGGANVPGLSEYMTDTLRLPVHLCNPWDHIEFHHLQPPNAIEKSMYITVAGLALINPKELFV